MKKQTFPIVFVMLAMVLIAMAFILPSQGNNDVAANVLYNKIVSYDLQDDYPTGPDGVMEIMNAINQYYYSSSYDTEKIEEVLRIQRNLMSREYIDYYPFEEHLDDLLQDIQAQNKEENKIIEITSAAPQYPSGDTSTCTVQIKQYTNKNVNFDVRYLLEKEDGFWKVVGWVDV